MGDSIKHEFGLGPVDTGRRMPDTPPTFDPNNPGNVNQGQPGAPITRPSFLTAFLANLGPALGGGLAQNGDPRFPFGTGLSGSLQGIQKQTEVNRQFGLQQQQEQRLAQQAASTQAYQQAETQRLQQITPLDVQEKKLNADLLQAQIGFFSNPGNIDSAIQDATKSLGKLSAPEQAQIDAARNDAKLKRSFDPISKAVTTISQDRIQTERSGLAVDKQELAAYLADPTLDKGIKNKNAATFAAWKAKQAPAAQILGPIIGPGNALDQQAELYFQTHELSAGLNRSPGTVAAIIKRAAELHPEGGLAGNQASFKADSESLQSLQKNFDQVSAFENTAIKNLDQVAKAGAKVPDLGNRFANVPVRQIDAKVLGTPQMAAFRTALLTAQTEAAKVLSSANANGVLSDPARKEAQDVLDGNLPFPAMMASINQLKTDFGNRHQSYQLQINDIKKRLAGGKPSGSSGNRVIDLTK